MAKRRVTKNGKASYAKPMSSSTAESDWQNFSDDRLLEVRICDLKVNLQGTIVERCIQRLYAELAARNLLLKPHCWVSDEWFSPDGIPGIAIPFYLVHPRLRRLERKQMLEVEGGTEAWCMKILRHEAGHAVDTAFRLHRRKKYRQVFGNYSAPYPDTYRPKPRSKNYVYHLERWYSQSHPAEDFAETFAVWLTPRSRWRKEYAGWNAIAKIELVNQLMENIAGQKPPVRCRSQVDPASRNRMRLGQYYEERQSRYCRNGSPVFDRELKNLFPQIAKSRRNKSAARFLQKNQSDLSRVVAHWTGEYRYNVNQVLREMIDRCRELELLAVGDETQLKQNAAVMLTAHTMKNLNGGIDRVAL